ncbi:hypothetical protein BK138_13955 [Paenibacillus rhizosphaerae]|uniref:DUF4367 domain-containing protein n=1 Tax=Paenibacillus rhizosphaerae TaxID=297318 RepID=A0A1R1ER24_9BACL|nr:hypothetical protein [Paenibacillus rhizosphaerae]OMF54294.1 hypothetical protein BK138_13955 [Paenibacillus rhizosphaerae]
MLLKIFTALISSTLLFNPNHYPELNVSEKDIHASYTTIQKAERQFENKFQRNIKVPQYVPLKHNYTGGFFDEAKGSLTLDYLDTNNNLKFEVKAIKGILNENVNRGEKIQLKDGHAYYLNKKEHVADYIVFQDKDNEVIYFLSMNKKTQGETHLQELIKAADSLQ